jgi:hypothetical protein
MGHDVATGTTSRAGASVADETVMMFGTCELTTTQLQSWRREDVLGLLMRHGVKRLTAERIVEIHCGGDATSGRARAHATSRSVSSAR